MYLIFCLQIILPELYFYILCQLHIGAVIIFCWLQPWYCYITKSRNWVKNEKIMRQQKNKWLKRQLS